MPEAPPVSSQRSALLPFVLSPRPSAEECGVGWGDKRLLSTLDSGQEPHCELASPYLED